MIEIEVESIPEYDLVAQMQKDLQDQKQTAQAVARPSFGAIGALGAGTNADVQGRARINSDNVLPLQSRRESLIMASRG